MLKTTKNASYFLNGRYIDWLEWLVPEKVQKIEGTDIEVGNIVPLFVLLSP